MTTSQGTWSPRPPGDTEHTTFCCMCGRMIGDCECAAGVDNHAEDYCDECWAAYDDPDEEW